MRRLLPGVAALILAACASSGGVTVTDEVKAPDEGKVRVQAIDRGAKTIVLSGCRAATSGRKYRLSKGEIDVGTVVADSVIDGTLTGRFVGAGDEVSMEAVAKGDAVSVTEVRDEAVVTGGDARTK